MQQGVMTYACFSVNSVVSHLKGQFRIFSLTIVSQDAMVILFVRIVWTPFAQVMYLIFVCRILNAYAKVPPKPKVPSTKSEFEELEAVPTSAAIDGPLEPPPASTAVVTDNPDESLVNYFSGAATIGSVPSAPLAGRVHPTESVASSHVPLIVPSVAQAHQTPPSVGSSAPPLPLHDTNAHTSRSTNLVTPAFFAPPSSSSASLAPPGSSMMPTAPPLHPNSASAQRPPYGTPLLQPFPPPTPPPSLTPAHNDRPVITRDRVKDALQRLVQSDEFIDLVYREMQKSLV
uniref:mRNA-decapping enzyme-like protein n=1 Tax=Arundo donax TaxID=35708 RepID=A0A0A9D8T1_ARUDO